LRFEQLSKSLNIWCIWNFLKISLIIPAPQLYGLIAKTWRGSYVSHKESVQWKNLIFEQFSKSLNIWCRWKLLKINLIIPAPQLLGLIAKTCRGAYFSHMESEQWKNLIFEQFSKSLNIWRWWKILKRSLIIPAPQLLGLIAKTCRGAYFSHMESEQWKNLKFEQFSILLNIWRWWKILKRSLIIPVPQFSGLKAITWWGAYFCHKESEQWKKFKIRASFKIA